MGAIMPDLTAQQLAALSELPDLEAMVDLYQCASPEFNQTYRVEVARMGSCRVLMIPELDSLHWNRIMGLGVGAPATEEILDEAIAALQRAGCTRFMAQISPLAQPAELPAWLRVRGFEKGLGWPKLLRDDQVPGPVATHLSVEKIGSEQAADFAALFGSAFGMPSELHPLFSGTVGKPGWHHYRALDGVQPVATGAMFISGDAAWLGFGSTLGSHRNQGGQSALIARRIADGLALGCKWFVTETGKDVAELPNPSYRNMLRAGFKVAYIRENYLYQPSDES